MIAVVRRPTRTQPGTTLTRVSGVYGTVAARNIAGSGHIPLSGPFVPPHPLLRASLLSSSPFIRHSDKTPRTPERELAVELENSPYPGKRKTVKLVHELVRLCDSTRDGTLYVKHGNARRRPTGAGRPAERGSAPVRDLED